MVKPQIQGNKVIAGKKIKSLCFFLVKERDKEGYTKICIINAKNLPYRGANSTRKVMNGHAAYFEVDSNNL